MAKTDIRSAAEASSPAASLFGGMEPLDDAYDECRLSSGVPREHWRSIVASLNAAGPELLDRQQDRARRMRHEDGATYNPFDTPTGRGTPWALEVIPLPVTAAEWAPLESGLKQRALLLDKILADIYGPQKLLQDGHVPAELIFANPRFLRPCYGIRPPGNRYLVYYAADIYRGIDGRFRVFRDYAANPSGLGYALENRIVMSRILPELYHQSQVQRLAPFFQTFHNSLMQRASRRREEPSIVLLSPGPDSPIYFEHALLSRYLGYPLVEGQDLTVRNGRIFLKKLAGLEPVETVFRHTEDCQSDPFALRRETTNGVAGLIQVSREQNIGLVNPVGSGFAETPGLQAFLKPLCRFLMGEDLILENHPVWWCGSPDTLNYVKAHLNELRVVPAMGPLQAATHLNDTLKAVQAAPYAFMGTAHISPAAAPAWHQGGVRYRHTLLRLFACATDQGYAVLPGGLAITASNVESLTDNCRERQQSKDVWVLSDLPVVSFSLMDGLQAIPEFKRSGDLPSRVADNLLWLGRYLERAEGLIRLLRSVIRRLAGEARPADVPELGFLLNLLRAENMIHQASNGESVIPRYRELHAQLHDALFRSDRPESVTAVLKRVQETARNVRDRLSLDSWRVINRLDGFADMQPTDLLEVLDETLFTLSAFSGLAMESMTRGLGWRFLDIGRRVERALNQAELIRIGLPAACSGSRSALEALLEIFDSIMTYRARYRSTFQAAPVLDLLLVDESNPKSLAFQISQINEHVDSLPPEERRPTPTPEKRMTQSMLDAVQSLELSGLNCRESGPEMESLQAFLEGTTLRLKDFAQHVSAHYLSRIQSTPHFSSGGRQ